MRHLPVREEVREVSHVLVVRADGHNEANAARMEAIAARSERHRRLAQAYLDKEDADDLAKGVPIERYRERCNCRLNDGSGMLHREPEEIESDEELYATEEFGSDEVLYVNYGTSFNDRNISTH